MDHQQAVDEHIAGPLRALIDAELSIVFYGLPCACAPNSRAVTCHRKPRSPDCSISTIDP